MGVMHGGCAVTAGTCALGHTPTGRLAAFGTLESEDAVLVRSRQLLPDQVASQHVPTTASWSWNVVVLGKNPEQREPWVLVDSHKATRNHLLSTARRGWEQLRVLSDGAI